jgi:hypothetical protein
VRRHVPPMRQHLQLRGTVHDIKPCFLVNGVLLGVCSLQMPRYLSRLLLKASRLDFKSPEA